MRVVCDNCGASYKIPESKLVRDVNKATCRKCGHGIVIRRDEPVIDNAPRESDRGEATAITSAEVLEARARAAHAGNAAPPPFPAYGARDYSDEVQAPTVVTGQPEVAHERTIPRQERGAQRPTTPVAPPPPPRTAGPVPATAPPPPVAGARPTYDPAGDMSMVMMSAFGGVIGAALMAFSDSTTQTRVGLGIALVSSFTALFVLLTGDRGRKEARVVLSVFAALFFSCMGELGFLAYRPPDLMGGLEALMAQAPTPPTDEAPPAEEAPAAAASAEPEPLLPANPNLSALEDVAAEEEAPAVAEAEPEPAGEPPPPAPPPAATPASSSSSAAERALTPKSGTSIAPSSSSSSSSTSTPPAKTTTPAPAKTTTPAPAKTTTPAPAASSSASQGVPISVLDTMLKNNKGVKQCFGLYRQETGALPTGRIPVEVTIAPSGTPTSAHIKSGQYQGSSLDSCLSAAIPKIQFPPWDGESMTYVYPFVLGG